MLTPAEIRLIQSTWLAVAADRERAGRFFYNELFRRAPDLEPLFSRSIAVQSRKLMETLAYVVDGLDNLQSLIPALRDLGRFHADRRIRPAQYDIVGAVLIETLRQSAGDSFSPEAESAWIKAYGVIAGVMTEKQSASPAPLTSASG